MRVPGHAGPAGAPRPGGAPGRAGLLLLILLVLSAGTATAPANQAPPEAAPFHLFLVGDAGEPGAHVTPEPVLAALATALREAPGRGAVVFLGDNLYPKGLPDTTHPERREMESRIDAQVDLAREAGVPAIFIPGNHDWARSNDDGWAAVRRQEARVEGRGGDRVRWLPDGGCPGPVIVDDLDPRLRLVLIDTQWWLHPGPRPEGEAGGCAAPDEESALAALREALAGAGPRRVIVAGHHPLASRGPHGGHFTLLDHLFPLRAAEPWLWLPLPVVGSAYPVARRNGISGQDLSAERYERMIAALLAAFAPVPPFLYASGHDHNLQLLDGPGVLGPAAPRHLVVSGSGIYGHGEPADADAARFASREAGFFRLDLAPDGAVRLSALAADRDGTPRELWSEPLN